MNLVGRLTYAELLADLEVKVAALRPFVVDLGLGETVVDPAALKKLGFALPDGLEEPGGNVPARQGAAQTEPRPRRFYGFSRTEASVKSIRERKTDAAPRDTWPITTREIWAE